MNRQEAMNIFGFRAEPTDEELTTAYRRLASKYHPDKGGTTADMQRVNEAREILTGARSERGAPNPRPRQSSDWSPYGDGGFASEFFDEALRRMMEELERDLAQMQKDRESWQTTSSFYDKMKKPRTRSEESALKRAKSAFDDLVRDVSKTVSSGRHWVENHTGIPRNVAFEQMSEVQLTTITNTIDRHLWERVYQS